MLNTETPEEKIIIAVDKVAGVEADVARLLVEREVLDA